MWFWGHAWAQHPVAVRRSHVWWFVPHFIATLPGRWRHFYAVEFVATGHKVGMRGREIVSLDKLPAHVAEALGGDKVARLAHIKE